MLFDSLTLRDIIFRNRIVVSPMCEYSSEDGFANDWHLVHLGSRAVGGAGLVFTEATAVEARGRISPQDLGIWKDEHIDKLKQITRFIEAQGAVAGMQLAHAGRKAAISRPWDGDKPLSIAEGGWKPVAPSAIPFDKGYQVPEVLTIEDIKSVTQSFKAAAQRVLKAGFKVVEIHAAHGYLLHEFLSPTANQRKDTYGGPFENRIRLLLEIVGAVRSVWPEKYPLFVRISGTDWTEPEGWDLEQSIELARHLKKAGVDLVDCSSGGLVPYAKIPAAPGFQIPISEKIRREAGIATGAVGFITSAPQAETIVRTGQADMIFLARELLRHPYWPLHASAELRKKMVWPAQYGRINN
jgi:2,4-dienoyl-CoA reductase-like NADH-dependent reductase (Old Yellow Enzyme family)